MADNRLGTPDRQTMVTLTDYRSSPVITAREVTDGESGCPFWRPIAVLNVALDEAWDHLPPKLQATMLKTTIAERILKSAAEGERNRERLREAALRDLAA